MYYKENVHIDGVAVLHL